jgi:Holliday junction resolvase RusA-like endonuclease
MTQHPPDKRRRDIDNPVKATLDALVHWGVLHDDSCIVELLVFRDCVDHTGHGRVVLDIEWLGV